MRHRLLRAAALAVALGLVSVVDACSSHGPTGVEELVVGSLTVSPDSVMVAAEPALFPDGARDLAVTVFNRSGQPISIFEPRVDAAPAGIVSVSRAMVVTGSTPGSALITVSAGLYHRTVKAVVVANPDTAIRIAGHRGFTALFPENTAIAVQGTFDAHGDAADIDVRLTKDDVPVLMHDATVDRTTNGTGAVRDLTYAQISRLDACSKQSARWGPCPVPSLRSVLEQASGRGALFIELKEAWGSAEVARLLADIRDTGMRHHVLLTSFDYANLRSIRKLDPDVPVGLLTSSLPSVAVVASLGRAVAMPDDRALLADPAGTRAFVSAAAARKLEVITWVVDRTDDARALAAMGIHRFISDTTLDRGAITSR